jgi:single-stranded-DNA-specific exonuclease
MLWKIFNPEEKIAETLAQGIRVSPLTAQILINRGISTVEQANVFLNPRLANLRDPLEIPNIVDAAKRVLQAKVNNESVLIYGDYDVDGVTGTCILIHTLRLLGINASYYIPHRYGEGYSLSLDSVKKIANSGVKLIITVDCGIASVAEIKAAKEMGVDVIVTDHHNLPKVLPAADAIVNPKMIPKDHPSKDLSGAGVAFKFAWALLRVSGIKDSQFLTSLLDLASLGTLSDVVPLTAENRILAVAGLRLISERRRVGIKFLAEEASLKGKTTVNHVYFALAPRINAAGRLEHAAKSVELLLTDDPVRAKSLASELNKINVARRGLGSNIKDEVFSRLDEKYIAENKLVVLSGKDWHPGVIGIVASQITDRFYRPAVLIGVNDGKGRGSARSIEGLNVYQLLDSCQDLFLDFGGHAGAAGFEIDPKNIPEFEQRLKNEANKVIHVDDLKPRLDIDAELDPGRITMNLIRELEIFDPHGEGNPAPVFMSKDLRLEDVRQVGKLGKHLKLKFFTDEVKLETIGFGMGGWVDKLSFDNNYDIVYRLEANEWNGFETAQLSLLDIKPASVKTTAGREAKQ